MTIHYHVTPITPLAALYDLAGRHFLVNYRYPHDVERAHQIGQSVLLDNGAFAAWQLNAETDWTGYYEWSDRWLDYPTTWAVIPDVIDGEADEQDALIEAWPHGQRGAPVWHMHEPISRLVMLTEEWPRVCLGSSDRYAVVMGDAWERRMDEAWNRLAAVHRRTPWVHMLRGMQCAARRWPFASVDSSDVARNHNRLQNTPKAMADRWDAMQCPARWEPRPEQIGIQFE